MYTQTQPTKENNCPHELFMMYLVTVYFFPPGIVPLGVWQLKIGVAK